MRTGSLFEVASVLKSLIALHQCKKFSTSSPSPKTSPPPTGKTASKKTPTPVCPRIPGFAATRTYLQNNPFASSEHPFTRLEPK